MPRGGKGEYYLALKKKKILLFVTTWMRLKIIMLSEIIQTQSKAVFSHLYVESKTVELLEGERRGGYRAWAVGEWGSDG